MTVKSLLQSLTLRAIALLACVLGASAAEAQVADCDGCLPRVAVKTNLLHDAVLTPDLGLEVVVGKRFSLSVEGVWAWWSNGSRNRCWRIAGGWCELRTWLGEAPTKRALTGHHLGLYGSMLTYDFEFGGKGWQSPDWTYGVGLSYGYSMAVASRLNLDFALRVGYSSGTLIKYKPQCGTYVCYSHSRQRYFGPTGLEITLVWFPGKAGKNNPVYYD